MARSATTAIDNIGLRKAIKPNRSAPAPIRELGAAGSLDEPDLNPAALATPSESLS
jgi:hypothetical protein